MAGAAASHAFGCCTALIVDTVTTLRGGPAILAAIPPALRAVPDCCYLLVYGRPSSE